ncbi:MAG: nitroreductase [Alistipes sp.]|nr:nitroreductase [Alistipes sp.]
MKKLFAIAILATIILGASCQQQQPAEQTPEPTPESNTTIEDILSRRSIRAYKEQAVPRDLLDQIVECGIWAPNGMNAQQWEVRIVDSKEWLDNITAAYKESVKGTPTERMVEQPEFKNMFRNAPAVIFVAHKPGHCTQVDCGLMAGNMMLAATSLDLGSICMMGPIGFFRTEEGKPFLESLNLSEGYELLLCVGIGYADEEPKPTPRNMDVVQYVE